MSHDKNYYLFHDPKNTKPLPWIIVFSVLAIWVHGGWIAVIIAWVGYYAWCTHNNNLWVQRPSIKGKILDEQFRIQSEQELREWSGGRTYQQLSQSERDAWAKYHAKKHEGEIRGWRPDSLEFFSQIPVTVKEYGDWGSMFTGRFSLAIDEWLEQNRDGNVRKFAKQYKDKREQEGLYPYDEGWLEAWNKHIVELPKQFEAHKLAYTTKRLERQKQLYPESAAALEQRLAEREEAVEQVKEASRKRAAERRAQGIYEIY